MKFSIIIPFYNVELYIEECIRSVAEQDYPKDDFEIICVDDCSPDNSRDIVQRLMSEYPNLKLICHSMNKRQGGARNTGIDVAKGEWILFLDSDDKYMHSLVLNNFDKLIQKHPQIKFIKSKNYNYIPCNDNCNPISSDIECKYLNVISSIKYLNSDYSTYLIWNGCWNKKFLDENNIRFREHVAFEDTDFGIKVGLYSAQIGCVEYPFYGYRYNPESITNKPRIKTFQDNLAAAKACYDLIKSNKLEDLASLGILKRIKDIILSFPKYSRNYSITDSMPIIHEVSKSDMLKKVMELPLTNKEKIVFFSIKHSPFVTVFLVKLGVYLKRKVFKFMTKI